MNLEVVKLEGKIWIKNSTVAANGSSRQTRSLSLDPRICIKMDNFFSHDSQYLKQTPSYVQTWLSKTRG